MDQQPSDLPPQFLPTRWQRVPQREIVVYSAYLDSRIHSSYPARTSPSVVVMAVVNMTEERPVYCHIYMYGNDKIADQDDRFVVPAIPGRLNPLHVRSAGGLGQPIMFDCPLGNSSVKPLGVKISPDNLWNPPKGGKQDSIPNENWIPIDNKKQDTIEHGWCISQVYGPYNEAQLLIEQFEWAKLEHVDKVFVYLFDASDSVMKVLQYYQQQGLVEIIPWKVHQLVNGHVVYYGQIVAFNDCIYRNRDRVRFLAIHDQDERVISRKSLSVLNEYRSLLDEHPNAAAFNLQSAGFLVTPGYNLTVYSNQRSDFFPHFTRSKVIVIPKLIVIMGVHLTFAIVPGYVEVKVPEQRMFFAHLRRQSLPGVSTYKMDESLNSISKLLAPAVEAAMRAIAL